MPSDLPESYLKYMNLAELVAQIGFCSTTFFCFILVYLTMFGMKRNFGSYKYLLILFPVVGILFATTEIILYPNVYSHNAAYIFYTSIRPFNMNQEVLTCFLAFYTGVYAATIAMLSVQFLYRYWAIFRETKLRFFKGWRFLGCIAYSVTFGCQWAFGIHYFNKRDTYSEKYMRIEMLQKFSIDLSETPAMIFVAYDSEGNIRWRNICCTLNMTLIMLIQYTVIICCAIRMYFGMEEKLKMLSISLRNLHNQFFKTLILQIVTPTITLFSPVMLIISTPLLDLEVDLPTGVFLCAFTIYPAMDAVIVMYIVKDYRKAARKMLLKCAEKFHAWLSTGDNERTSSRTKSTAANVPAVVNNN